MWFKKWKRRHLDSRELLSVVEAASVLDCTPDAVILSALKGKLRIHEKRHGWKFLYEDVLAIKDQGVK